MEDYSFKIYKVKEGGSSIKRGVKIFLVVFAFFLTVSILIKIVGLFFNSGNNSGKDGVVLIKSEEKSIKRVPEEKGGLSIKNLDIGVYNVISDQEKGDVEPSLKKVPQDVVIKNNDVLGVQDLDDQSLLADKINEISVDDEMIVNESSANTNIKINMEQVQKVNVNDLEKLGNNALVKNISDKKYIKPGIKVQLLALKSKKSIEIYWEDLLSRYDVLLKDKNYYIEKIDLNKTISIYRLQVGMFASNDDANAFCKEYVKIANKNKVDCIVVK
jgi:hypothetical protein